MKEEVQNVLRFIQDSLKAADIPYETELTDENPNACFICSADKAGRENVGIIGWSEEKKSVIYAALNPMTVRHDDSEGINEDDSKCWWQPSSAEMMVWFLNGKVSEIIHEEIARRSR